MQDPFSGQMLWTLLEPGFPWDIRFPSLFLLLWVQTFKKLYVYIYGFVCINEYVRILWICVYVCIYAWVWVCVCGVYMVVGLYAFVRLSIGMYVWTCACVRACVLLLQSVEVTFWFFPSIVCSEDLKLSSSCLVVNAFAHWGFLPSWFGLFIISLF